MDQQGLVCKRSKPCFEGSFGYRISYHRCVIDLASLMFEVYFINEFNMWTWHFKKLSTLFGIWAGLVWRFLRFDRDDLKVERSDLARTAWTFVRRSWEMVARVSFVSFLWLDHQWGTHEYPGCFFWGGGGDAMMRWVGVMFGWFWPRIVKSL